MSSVYRPHSFQPDRAQGSLHLEDGRRVAALSVDSIHALHLALIEQFGENAPDLLYRSGYEWALQDMARHQPQMHEGSGFGRDLWQREAKSVFETWWRPFAATGWGHGAFDCSSIGRGVVFVELRSGAIAPAFAGSDQPVCHLYAGLFAGALSFLQRTEHHSAEMQCVACGAAACVFVVGPGSEVDAAETWRQQGMTVDAITPRLR